MVQPYTDAAKSGNKKMGKNLPAYKDEILNDLLERI
tara:strand:- start:340 stop:447 length:108 start_codon:yes stop_codon:yes gene_type:complete